MRARSHGWMAVAFPLFANRKLSAGRMWTGPPQHRLLSGRQGAQLRPDLGSSNRAWSPPSSTRRMPCGSGAGMLLHVKVFLENSEWSAVGRVSRNSRVTHCDCCILDSRDRFQDMSLPNLDSYSHSMQLHVAITDPNRHTSSDLTRRVGGDKQQTERPRHALARYTQPKTPVASRTPWTSVREVIPQCAYSVCMLTIKKP